MNWTDAVNGAFELAAGLALLYNCWRLYRDRCVRGVSVASTSFFMAWGYWNIYFYPVNGFMWSFAAGLLVVTANTLWVAMMIHYRRREAASG